jgi:hypothetical protein
MAWNTHLRPPGFLDVVGNTFFPGSIPARLLVRIRERGEAVRTEEPQENHATVAIHRFGDHTRSLEELLVVFHSDDFVSLGSRPLVEIFYCSDRHPARNC